MSKSFHSNQPLKLFSVSVCLILLIICNVFTFQLTKSRLAIDNNAIKQEPRSTTELETQTNSHPEMPSGTPMPDNAQPFRLNEGHFREQGSTNEKIENPTGALTSKTEISRTPYFASLAIQSICIALVILYLIMSRFSQKTLLEIFVNSDKITIFILGTLLLALSTSVFEIVIL